MNVTVYDMNVKVMTSSSQYANKGMGRPSQKLSQKYFWNKSERWSQLIQVLRGNWGKEMDYKLDCIYPHPLPPGGAAWLEGVMGGNTYTSFIWPQRGGSQGPGWWQFATWKKPGFLSDYVSEATSIRCCHEQEVNLNCIIEVWEAVGFLVFVFCFVLFVF